MTDHVIELAPGIRAERLASGHGLRDLQAQGPFVEAVIAAGRGGVYHAIRLDETVRQYIRSLPSNRLERRLAELGLQFGVGDDAKLATVTTKRILGPSLTTLIGEIYDLPDDRVSETLRAAFLGHNGVEADHLPPGTIVSLFGTPVGLQIARIYLRRLLDAGEVAAEPIEEALSWIAYQLAEPDRRTAALIMRHQRRNTREQASETP